jgi:hypothetical protein
LQKKKREDENTFFSVTRVRYKEISLKMKKKLLKIFVFETFFLEEKKSKQKLTRFGRCLAVTIHFTVIA